MTELQIGLLGLGGVAIAGVLVYNTWQEYRHRKLAKKLLDSEHVDVLLNESASVTSEVSPGFIEPEDEFVNEVQLSPERSNDHPVVDTPTIPVSYPPNERIEPVFRMEEDTPFSPEPESKTPVEPSVLVPAAVVSRVEEAKDTRELVDPLQLLSPHIDYVASFEAVEPAPVYQILESQRDVLAQVQKPIHWIGYNEFSREWEPIIDDGKSEYRRLRIALQMVDRRGPMSDRDLSVFHVAMQDLADELMAIADMSPRQPALDAAVLLDQFCASVDIQIGINVISQGQVFPGTKIRALAEAAGMVIDADGRFVRCDDEGNVLYVLLNQEASGFSVESMKTMSTHGITFLLDVPRVSHGERVFNQMVDLARRFADVLKGSLVDDNRRPLSEGALEPIRRQVGQYQSQMAARNLPAGGALSQRLFS
ncbi:MAG: cell division protein ZipA C-terminal FtsZ-binding domain-containing protein [Betaproteobacteria bacterium]